MPSNSNATPSSTRIAAGKLQIGLWCSLCSNIAAEIISDSRLRLDPARHRAFAQRNSRPGVAVAGGPARHRDADRAPGLERRRAGQARASTSARRRCCSLTCRTPRRPSAPSPPRAIRRQGIRGVVGGRARQPLRPHARLSRQGRRRNLRAGAGRDRAPRSSSSRRSPRSRASTACSSARPIWRPRSAISAIRSTPTCRRPCRTRSSGSRRSASRPASSPATRRRRAAISTGAIMFVAVGADVGLLASNADALAKKFKS